MRGLKEGPLSYLKSLYFIRLGLFIMGRGHSNWSLHRTGSLPPYNISFVGMDDIVFFVENAFHPWRGFSEGKGKKDGASPARIQGESAVDWDLGDSSGVRWSSLLQLVIRQVTLDCVLMHFCKIL